MPIYEGKTVEEAIVQGLHSLDLTLEEVSVSVQKQAKKGFLGFGKQLAKVSMEPVQDSSEVTNSDEHTKDKFQKKELSNDLEATVVKKQTDEVALQELTDYLTNITNQLHASTKITVEQKDSIYMFHLETEQAGKLIGKHGKVLNALQYLAQVFIHRVAENKITVVVNVGNYREKREAILQRLAQKTANTVKKSGKSIALEPMPAFERKQIHFVLSKDSAINTYSKGEEPHRYLVVELAKK